MQPQISDMDKFRLTKTKDDFVNNQKYILLLLKNITNKINNNLEIIKEIEIK